MKRIMLLSDFSDTARNAAMYALKMFENEDVTFYLMNAYDLEFSGSPYVIQIKQELGDESLKKRSSVASPAFPGSQNRNVIAFWFAHRSHQH